MRKEPKLIKIALVDDHVALRNGLARLINSFGNCEVIQEASNGLEFLDEICEADPPNLVLLDLSMPRMDGCETARMLSQYYPQIYSMMLTMYDTDLTLIRLLQVGVRGFLKKDVSPPQLKHAIKQVLETGYYYSEQTANKMAHLLRVSEDGSINAQKALLTENEIGLLKMICSELTYKEISEQMNLNPRTVDTIRDQLFTKLGVKSRIGLAMIALRNGIVVL